MQGYSASPKIPDDDFDVSTAFDHLEVIPVARAPRDAGAGDVESDNVEAKPAETFPCYECAGTGFYRKPRVNQPKAHCFACNGRGWFKTPPSERFKKRQKAAQRKVAKGEANRADYAQNHPETYAFLQGAAGKSDFARSMLEAATKFGHLTDNQQAAAESMRAKWAAADAQRAAEKAQREKPAAQIDLAPIIAAMNTALGNGLKRPKVRLECGELSRAPDSGKNPGAIYFKRGETYLGKIMQSGGFVRSRDCDDATMASLVAAANDPLASMVAYGRETGSCSCCGRELTDPESVAAGIGPICATKYGF